MILAACRREFSGFPATPAFGTIQIMFVPSDALDELAFAFRCYVYFRWHTHRRRPLAALERLAAGDLQAIHPEIHILELSASEAEIALLASLQPTESVSTAASKLKGAASKKLRELQGLDQPTTILGGGYFAATFGDNTSSELDRYLEHQGEHHGYASRVRSPVWVQAWPVTQADWAALQTAHAVTILRWHLVISTWNRQGVFTREAGRCLCDAWHRQSAAWRIRLSKVSVLPDHIHIAAWSHPTVAPGQLVLGFMSTSSELIVADFPHLLIEAKVPRLWKPGAYVGTYGDIRKAAVRDYLRSWESRGPEA